MPRPWLLSLVILVTLVPRPAPADETVRPTALRFEVTLAPDLVSAPQDGRLLVVLGRPDDADPRRTIGKTGLNTPPVPGRAVTGFAPGQVAALDRGAVIFPITSLDVLPPGEYAVQAVLDTNRDLNSPSSPGNLYSLPGKVTLDTARGGPVRVELTKQVPPETAPADTPRVKFLKVKSELLSAFHGRPMYLRAGVVLPPDFDREPNRRYPLRVHIGGYGTRYTNALWRGRGPDGPPMLLLHLDGAGPLGDPYQVNSANHGPYGDAVTKELIPLVEQRFRGIGRPYARVLDGASTGGWVSLALQVFYPDFFNGTWSHCPDPVDFRAFELLDIYREPNAYVNRFGFERPAARTLDGEVEFTVRHEVHKEIVRAKGANWTLSGKDWGSWNATFGPRGKDGLPVPLWDGKTGQMNRTVLDHWKKYDLRLHLETNWATLGPKLHGKLRIWVGDADDYYLNNAVHLLDDFLKTARPAYGGKITYGPRAGHSWQGISQKDMLAEMAAVVKRGRKAGTLAEPR